ncbi:MAG: hypothetical protein LBQ69_02850 [Treponema sp.]|jgi:hypothetical protein|nr:hypothetical protein [Treponema sp.]
MNLNGNTTAGQKAMPISEMTFDTLLDETCERLLDRQVKYSIERIHELEKRLDVLERELDEFLRKR